MGRIVEMPLPRLGETMEEGRIGQWFKQPGEKFRRGETLLEVESDKTTVEVPALQDGILIEWLVSLDQMVPVESAIARIEIEGEAVGVASAFPVPSPRRKPGPSLAKDSGFRRNDGLGTRARASTAARAFARKSQIDLATLAGSGRNNRVTRADIARNNTPARATYHVETPHGKIFMREWPALGTVKGAALLIHGLFADSQSFITLGRMLAGKGFRTLAFDLPGHGETQSTAASVADIVAVVAAALPPAKLHIIGHSYGAVIATQLADHALSLTLLSPAGTGEEISADFIAAMLGGHIDQALSYIGEKLPPEVQADLATHLSTNADQLKSIACAVAENGRQTISILAKLASLTIPVTAIYMRDDIVIPAHHALNLPSNIAARFFPGASHLPHWRDPDLVVKLVVSHSLNHQVGG